MFVGENNEGEREVVHDVVRRVLQGLEREVRVPKAFDALHAGDRADEWVDDSEETYRRSGITISTFRLLLRCRKNEIVQNKSSNTRSEPGRSGTVSIIADIRSDQDINRRKIQNRLGKGPPF